MKKIYLLPLFALSLAALPLAGCDDNSSDSSVPPAPAVEATDEAAPVVAPTETPADEAATEQTTPVESSITVTNAHAYATAASSKNGAVFATINNASAKGDILLTAKTNIALRVEVHQSYEDPQTGAMLMRRTSGVDVPANGSAQLEPKGFHIMLLDLISPLVAGSTFDVELRFRDAGKVVVPITVQAVGAEGAAAEPEVQHESADHDDHAAPEVAPDASASEDTAESTEETPAADATNAE